VDRGGFRLRREEIPLGLTAKIGFKLRFPEREIRRYAARYPAAVDSRIEEVVAPAVRSRGFLTRGEFLELCRWKTPRSAPLCAANDEEYVNSVTRAALAADNERLRIEALRLLAGVSWPTASAILHFCSRDPYPILDVRALWSLSVRQPSKYDFPFWNQYTTFLRRLAGRLRISMRDLDRALWQYSAERQRVS
jgi:hypothetical protein